MIQNQLLRESVLPSADEAAFDSRDRPDSPTPFIDLDAALVRAPDPLSEPARRGRRAARSAGAGASTLEWRLDLLAQFLDHT